MIVAGLVLLLATVASAQDKPNIVVIWGDDIGVHNISAYDHGIMGYKTPNIDRIAKEGALFTDFYAQQSRTAGRASFIMWIFVPIQSVIKDFLGTIDGYPFQGGSSLNAAGINYDSLKAMSLMERLSRARDNRSRQQLRMDWKVQSRPRARTDEERCDQVVTLSLSS